MSNWYYCKNGKQEGPIALDQLKGMIASGDLANTLLVWKIGTPEWVKIHKHPELISSIPTPPPLPVPSAARSSRPKSLFKRIHAVVRRGAKGSVQDERP